MCRVFDRPYRLRQPVAFDVDKKEYLCPLCERLCNTALPLLPAPPLPSGSPPPISEEVYSSSVEVILKLRNQVSRARSARGHDIQYATQIQYLIF